ncbi:MULTISPECIES: hypothetical protein [Cyanophyceae]|nr:hypothetical protein [Nodosilinea sp. FACHB-141]MBD2112811.1 hypothetical protein [Nodosilinea sp. FACHB-141]
MAAVYNGHNTTTLAKGLYAWQNMQRRLRLMRHCLSGQAAIKPLTWLRALT